MRSHWLRGLPVCACMFCVREESCPRTSSYSPSVAPPVCAAAVEDSKLSGSDDSRGEGRGGSRGDLRRKVRRAAAPAVKGATTDGRLREERPDGRQLPSEGRDEGREAAGGTARVEDRKSVV